MADPQFALDRRALKTPRDAAIAGILFALFYGIGLVLIRLSIPADIPADSSWVETNSRSISLGLNLVPLAGIAFLCNSTAAKHQLFPVGDLDLPGLGAGG
jgi:hypothetical protein